MPFVNENVAAKLSTTNPYQVGESNVDNNEVLEQNIALPWAADPAGSYVYYDCTVGVMLDSGIVVHNRLPQSNPNKIDTLATVYTDDPAFEHLTAYGVNLNSKDQYKDIVQRMGHSRYWFRLWGQALRIGYRVPIPGIKTIGGVPAIPYDKNPQWAYNRIAPGGNYSGAILWHAAWSLWYTTDAPPVNSQIPEVDPSAHISGSTPPPAQQRGMQMPYSQADDSATV